MRAAAIILAVILSIVIAAASPASAQLATVVATCPGSRTTPYPVGTQVLVTVDQNGNLCLSSSDSGAVPVEVTLGAGTLSSGNALGLFTIPVARSAGGGGIITKIIWKSVNGDGTAKVAKMWDAKPVNTTCTNGSAFVGSDTDDAWLIAGATQLTWTPVAPSVTTGDTAFYYEFTGLTISYHNHDGAPIPAGAGVGTNNGIASSQNVYLCVIAGASDTLDVSHAVRVTVSGPQD